MTILSHTDQRVALRAAPMAVLIALAVANPVGAQSSSAIWLDLTPLSRNILGAETELSSDFAVGWSTGKSLRENGWRVLGGFSRNSESNDNFGSTVETSEYDLDFRAGRRWATAALTSDGERWYANWGVDLVLGLDHIGTTTTSFDFHATNTTDIYRLGAGGVVAAGYKLSNHFNLAIEGRLDAWYLYDKTLISDNFSGSITSIDEGWGSSLTPPLQLFLCYQFSAK